MKASAVGLAVSLTCAGAALCAERAAAPAGSFAYDAIIARHAQANGVPEALIRRVIMRESRYNPRARNRSYYGMMQISSPTARAMGYRGAPEGLLDADVNLTYAVRYLAGAYKTAGGNHDRAVGYYARGYYYDAKRKGLLAAIGLGRNGRMSTPPALAAATPVQAAAAPVTVAAAPPPSYRAPVPAPGPTLAAAAADPAIVMASAVPMPPYRAPAPGSGPSQAAAAPAIMAAAAVPMPPRRDAVPAPQQLAQAAPAVRSIDPTAAPVFAASLPTARPRAVATTGSIAPRVAAPARPGAPVEPAAPVSMPLVSMPPVAPKVASAGPAAPVRPTLASADAARAPAAPTPGAVRAPAAPMPPRR